MHNHFQIAVLGLLSLKSLVSLVALPGVAGLVALEGLLGCTLSQQLLLASQLQRHPARVLVRGCYDSLQLMLDLRARTVLPAL